MVMRNILTALIAAGSIVGAALVTASSADAQWAASSWPVGGDYYYNPSAYSSGSAPLYDYTYGSTPLYDYGSVPGYGVGVEPMQTVQTIETVRTVRPASRSIVHRQVVTTRTTIRSFVTNTYLRPLYDYAGIARPLYNTVATSVAQTVAASFISGIASSL
jgi:hypothetical protein